MSLLQEVVALLETHLSEQSVLAKTPLQGCMYDTKQIHLALQTTPIGHAARIPFCLHDAANLKVPIFIAFLAITFERIGVVYYPHSKVEVNRLPINDSSQDTNIISMQAALLVLCGQLGTLRSKL